MLSERIKIYNFLKQQTLITTTSQDDWIKKWFASETKVNELYNYLNGNNPKKIQFYTNSITDFYKKYCCDLFANSQYCVGSTQQTTTQQTTTQQQNKVDPTKVSPNFACILKNSLWKDLVTPTGDSNHIMFTVGNMAGREYHFYGDGKFMYNDVKPYKSNIMGTWECNGDADFVVNTEDQSRFDSKVNKWSYHVNESKIIKKIVYKNLKRYSK